MLYEVNSNDSNINSINDNNSIDSDIKSIVINDSSNINIDDNNNSRSNKTDIIIDPTPKNNKENAIITKSNNDNSIKATVPNNKDNTINKSNKDNRNTIIKVTKPNNKVFNMLSKFNEIMDDEMYTLFLQIRWENEKNKKRKSLDFCWNLVYVYFDLQGIAVKRRLQRIQRLTGR